MRVKLLFNAFVEDNWHLFTGLRVTLFHWSHNERIYLGFFGSQFWRWRFVTTPFPLRKSFRLRRT